MIAVRYAMLIVGVGVSCRASSTPVPGSETPMPEPVPALSEPAAAGASPAVEFTPLSRAQVEAIVAHPERSADDRATDARRFPVELLLFTGIAPGMKVADIGAGLGYTTELLARAVGPTGTVYGHNPPFVLERFAQKGWTERLALPVMANTVRLDRTFDDPFTAEVTDLQLVVNILFYHDFEWQKIDRAAHNAGVFAALAPGGEYVVVDHSAIEGAGMTGSQTLHRVEQALVRRELEAAGFEYVEEADFMRNPADTRDWNALPWKSGRDESADRFVVKFRKPRG